MEQNALTVESLAPAFYFCESALYSLTYLWIVEKRVEFDFPINHPGEQGSQFPKKKFFTEYNVSLS